MARMLNRSHLFVISGTLALIALNQSVLAQGYTYTPSYAPTAPVPAADNQAAPTYTPDQLDQMLGPIALYPDPLLSQALAASTYPQDIASAAQWLQDNPNPTDDQISAQPWDPSVQALAHFPSVISMMAGDMDWTEALGTAFANQQAAVMDSVQRLRAQAQAAQTLVSTPQQQVVQDNGAIEILPAQPDVICVPEYDPGVVYATPTFGGPFITFGVPCPFGAFLDLDFDFHNHRFVRGVHFDRDRRPIFDRVVPWQHDVRRPIPRPVRPFFPPRAPNNGRGWSEPRRAPGVFRPTTPARRPAVQPAKPERPVVGLPARPTPQPRPPVAPVQPRPAPAQPRPPIPRAPVHPIEPRPIAQPPRVERPVTGLPARAPAPAPRPAPIMRPAPVMRPAPAPAPRPSPVFSPGGAGASERGHESIKR